MSIHAPCGFFCDLKPWMGIHMNKTPKRTSLLEDVIWRRDHRNRSTVATYACDKGSKNERKTKKETAYSLGPPMSSDQSRNSIYGGGFKICHSPLLCPLSRTGWAKKVISLVHYITLYERYHFFGSPCISVTACTTIQATTQQRLSDRSHKISSWLQFLA